MSNREFKNVDIELIEFDLENPRIIKELSAIEKNDRAEKAQALLILSHSDEPGPAREELEKSIAANGGISRPIELVMLKEPKAKKKYKVIDGNTRLAIFKKFKKHNPDEERWQSISSCIYDEDNEEKLDDIRLLAHFMPVKQWSLYAKGQYINKLCQTKDFDDIALKLGGKTSTIRELQKAYIFFTEHFEEVCKKADNFAGADERKFSHFIEAGKGAVEVALESHFASAEDGKRQFAEWVNKGKFRMAIHVRHLPSVLNDDNAREAFIKGKVVDIEAAKDLLPKGGESNINLNDASIEELSIELARKLSSVDRKTMSLLQDGTMHSTLDSLMLLAIDLEKVIEEIEEKK
jgi:hypothetical protein